MLQTLRMGAAVIVGGLLLAGLPTTTMAQPSFICASSKEKAVAVDVLKRFKCFAKAAKKGEDRERTLNADIQECLDKVTTKTLDKWNDAEAVGGCATDANAFDLNVDTFGDGTVDSVLNQIDRGWAVNATSIGYRGVDGPRPPQYTPVMQAGIVQLVAPGTTASLCAKKQLIALAVFGKKLHLCEKTAIKKGIPHDQNADCVNKATGVFVKKFDKATGDCINTADRDTLGGYLLGLSNLVIPNIPRFDGCGNGLVTNGMSGTTVETCDDGNTENFDSCPSDCVVDACTPTASPRSATLVIAGPNHLDVASVIVELDYPEGQIDLPGTGFAPASIQDLTFADSFDSVDFDHALRVVSASAGAFGQAQIANLDFVDCSGAVVPVPGDFTCTVQQAFGAGGTTDYTATTTCTVTIP